MGKVYKFWQAVILDTLGVLLMLAALATGWLPGPGGIPLFIIGLSLISINHKWARRYIDLLRQYADRVGDLIFLKNPRVQLAYDLTAPLLLGGGIFLILRHAALWQLSFGVSMTCTAIVLFLGNRDRWKQIRKQLKRKR